MYIYVGGTGSNTGANYGTRAGGFNGGGAGNYVWDWTDTGATDTCSFGGNGGGGATHIATEIGLLSTLSSKVNSILIVAGGGASNYSWHWGSYYKGNIAGGHAGGASGSGTKSGLQSGSAGNGTFGQGGNASGMAAGGGGGFYGGGGGSGGNGNYGSQSDAGGAGGGSGYIGNTLLESYGEVTKSMYCYGCAEDNTASQRTIPTASHSSTPTSGYAKEGHGYAKIQLIEADS